MMSYLVWLMVFGGCVAHGISVDSEAKPGFIGAVLLATAAAVIAELAQGGGA